MAPPGRSIQRPLCRNLPRWGAPRFLHVRRAGCSLLSRVSSQQTMSAVSSSVHVPRQRCSVAVLWASPARHVHSQSTLWATEAQSTRAASRTFIRREPWQLHSSHTSTSVPGVMPNAQRRERMPRCPATPRTRTRVPAGASKRVHICAASMVRVLEGKRCPTGGHVFSVPFFMRTRKSSSAYM